MFRAYDATRERLVAVKLFKLDLPPERGHQLVAEFERLIATELTHPAIAAPLATGISGVCAFLVQDYVAADSLDLAIREHGPAPATNALRVAAQLAGALDSAASAGVTHGALHPRDILLSSDDTRITGLGVTRALERIAVVAPVRRPYTAPERMAGEEWDRRADVFSLAALTHELMWGRRVSGLGAQAVESLPEIPGADLAALRAVFARALAEQPAERFDTAVAFVEALEQACPDVTMAPAPVPAKPAKRRAAPIREIEPKLPLDEAAQMERPVAIVPEPDAIAPVPQAVVPEPQIVHAAPVEEPRFRQVEVAPRIVEPEIARYEPPTAVPVGLITGYDAEPLSALERTRSAVWPLVLALVVGIGIGFAGGYGVGTRDQPAAQVATAAPAGREFTESAVTPAATNSELRTQNPEPKTLNPAPLNPEPRTVASEPKNLKSEVRNLKSPAPARVKPGALAVVSRPSGARVYMDGKLIGKTPLSLPSVAAGSHAIRIQRDGYRRWSSSVHVGAGEKNRVTASLER